MPDYKPRLQKWFTIDRSTEFFLDEHTNLYAAKYNGKDPQGNADALNDGTVGRTYLVKNLAVVNGVAKLDAPNPPFDTGESY